MNKENINKIVEMLNLDDLKNEIIGYFNEQEYLLIDNLKEYNKAEFIYFNEALDGVLNDNIEWFLKENYSIEEFNKVFEKVNFGAFSDIIYNQLDLYDNINYYKLIDGSLIYEKWGDYVKTGLVYDSSQLSYKIRDMNNNSDFKIKNIGIDKFIFQYTYKDKFNYLDNQVLEKTYTIDEIIKNSDEVVDIEDEIKFYHFLQEV